MKFKSKEELIRGAKEGALEDINDMPEAYQTGISDAFKSFAERVEFYGKYRYYGYLQLKKDHKKVWKIYVEEDLPAECDDADDDINGYNNWLFDHCFGDVKE